MTKRKNNSSLLLQYSVLGVATAAVVGGAIYARKRKENGLPLLPMMPASLPPAPGGWPPPASPNATKSAVSKYVSNSFPLRQWMKGSYVSQLQSALVAKGQSVSVDGYWGPQTQSALNALGIPTPIAQSAFQALVGGSPASASLPSSTAVADNPSSSISDNARNLAVSAAVDGEVDNAYFKTRPYAFAKKMTKVFTEPLNRTKEIARIEAGDYIGKHLGKSIDMSVNGTKVRFARVRLRADKFPDREGWVWSGTIESRTTGPGTSGLTGFSGVVVTAPTFIKDNFNRQVEVLPNTLLGEAMGVRNGLVSVRAKDGSTWSVSLSDVAIR